MRDIVSRKAVSELVKIRLNKVLAGVGSAEDIEDPFDRGKATAYENVLYDISARLPSTESEAEIESLKAITELAVKGLREIIQTVPSGAYEIKFIADTTLSEIARIQNAQT